MCVRGADVTGLAQRCSVEWQRPRRPTQAPRSAPWALSCRSTAARPWPTPRASSASPSASSTPARPATRWSWWCPRWATRPTSCVTSPSRSARCRHRVSSTCCSPPASASRWRCWRWRSPTSATRPARTPAARRGSSPTRRTARRGSSTSRRAASATRSTRAAIVIVAGFQGVSQDTKEITTLGRGGSDTTAVALAAALDAEVCEIYTDVDGVFTADPRIVATARRLAHITYEEMLEMAASGAKVLHLRCVEYARRYDIPVHVRSSFSTRTGTWVSDKLPTDRRDRRGRTDGASHHLGCRTRPQRGQDHRRRRARQAGRGSEHLPGPRGRRDQHRHDRAERLRGGDRPHGHLLHAAQVRRPDGDGRARRNPPGHRLRGPALRRPGRQDLAGRRGHALAPGCVGERSSARSPRPVSTSR